MHASESADVARRSFERTSSPEATPGTGTRRAGAIATGAFATIMTVSGLMFLLGPAPVVQGIGHLGYPRYFMIVLGVAKLLGVGALLAPRARTLREWAYAGFTFTMIGAVLSHASSGDAPTQAVPSMISLGLLLTSYFLRRGGVEATPSQHSVGPARPLPGRLDRIAPWFARAALLPPAVIFALVGARYLANPVGAAAAVGISLTTPEAVTVARVASGVFPLTFALFVGSCIASKRRLLTALVLTTTLVAIVTVVRVFGIVFEGAAGESAKLLRAEVALLTLTACALVIESRRRRRLGGGAAALLS